LVLTSARRGRGSQLLLGGREGQIDERLTREPRLGLLGQPPPRRLDRLLMIHRLFHQVARQLNRALHKLVAVLGLEELVGRRLALHDAAALHLGVVAVFRIDDVVEGKLPEGDEEGGAVRRRERMLVRNEREPKRTHGAPELSLYFGRKDLLEALDVVE
jgi:hypothetical protein